MDGAILLQLHLEKELAAIEWPDELLSSCEWGIQEWPELLKYLIGKI